MARWDIKILFTREYSTAIEALTADEAQAIALAQIGDTPDKVDETTMVMEITRGVG